MSEETPEVADVEAVAETTREEREAQLHEDLSAIFDETKDAMPEEWRDHAVDHAEAQRRQRDGLRDSPDAEAEAPVEAEAEAEVDEETEAEEESEEGSNTEELVTLSFTHGDQVFDVPENAVIEITVDGEKVEVPLTEIKNGLSGQKAIAQRFSALDAERKALAAETSRLQGAKEHVASLAENGQALEAVDYILQEAGLNSDTFVSMFFEQIAQPLEKYMTMSPEDQRLWAEQNKAERNRLQYEQVMQQNEQLLAEKQQAAEVRQIQTQHGLDDVQFADLYYRLNTEIEQGTIPRQPVTAALVGQYHTLLTREDWIRGSLKEVNSKYAEDDAIVASILYKVNERARNGEVSQQDVLDLVTETYGMPAKVKKAKDLKKNLAKKGNKASLDAGISNIPGDTSFRGSNEHFLDSLNQELSSATSAEERRQMIKKHKQRYK